MTTFTIVQQSRLKPFIPPMSEPAMVGISYVQINKNALI